MTNLFFPFYSSPNEQQLLRQLTFYKSWKTGKESVRKGIISSARGLGLMLPYARISIVLVEQSSNKTLSTTWRSSSTILFLLMNYSWCSYLFLFSLFSVSLGQIQNRKILRKVILKVNLVLFLCILSKGCCSSVCCIKSDMQVPCHFLSKGT